MDNRINYSELNKFESANNRKATLKAVSENSKYNYEFEVETPILFRMKNENDNKVELLFSDGWHSFYASGISSKDGVEVSVKLLENNNKRSRYIINIASSDIAFDAKAEGLLLL